MEDNKLIKYENGQLTKVSNAISLTNKILDLVKLEPLLIPYRKGNKWGFCREDKTIVIECIYYSVKRFSENFAVVNKNGKYGFIDKNGEITGNGLMRHFNILNPLKEGLSRVGNNSNRREWGFVNKDNSQVIEFIYESASDFCEGLACVRKNGKSGFIDKTNTIIIPFIYDNVHSFVNGLSNVRIGEMWGVIDKTGKVVIPIEFNDLDEIIYLTDQSNNQIYPKIIQIGSEFSLNIYNNNSPNNRLYNCIDKYGLGFSDDLIDVEFNSKWGFVDRNNNQIIDFLYDDITPFSEGLSGILKGEYWGFIDQSGNKIIDFKYEQVTPFLNGLAEVKLNNKWGFINSVGIEYWED